MEPGTDWEDYRRLGLALLPCRPNSKTPAVKGFDRWPCAPGDKAVASWAAHQPAFNPAILVGLSHLAVVDIDNADLVAAVVKILPETPIQVVTPSGGRHLYFRCSEPLHGRNLRAFDIAVDIKAGRASYVLAPPAQIDGRKYRFLSSGFEKLDDIPELTTTLVDKMIAALGKPREFAPAIRPRRGERNDWLFRHCLKQARHCTTFEELLDCAETANDDLPHALPMTEVEQIANSAWRYQCEDKNWVNSEAVAQIPESIRVRICQGPSGCDALALYVLLRNNHGGRATDFFIAIRAMTQANVLPGMSEMRLRRARDHLCAVEVIELTHQGGRGKGDPARFRFTV
jgi:hypothetical protein